MNRNAIFYALGAGAALILVVWLIASIDLDVVSLSLVKRISSVALGYKQSDYLVSVCAYIALFVLLAACFIPVTVVMTILGGYLFGGFYGGMYAAVGATLGGTVVFLLVRYFFRDRVKTKYAQQLERFNRNFNSGAWYLLCLHVSPVTPTFAINLFVGLTDITVMTYMWTALVGMLPGSLIYAYAGEKLHHIKRLSTIMTPCAFMVLLSVSCIGLIIAFVSRIKNAKSNN